MAKKGARKATEDARILPSCEQAKLTLRTDALQEWGNRWAGTGGYEETRKWMPSLDLNKSQQLLRGNKMIVSRAVQLITNHNNLAYCTAKKDKRVDPKCRRCRKAHEKGWHIARSCEQVANKIPEGKDWTVKELFSFLKTETAEFLLNTRPTEPG